MTAERIRPDANGDADWLRSLAWDLPEDVDGLVSVLGLAGLTLEQFMTLPAARAMPDQLRRALTK